MTLALQRSTSIPREQRDQAIILLDKGEKRPWQCLFSHYQKDRFPGYSVRCFKVAPGENPTSCLFRNSAHITLTPDSYVVVCNGALNVTEHLARTFFSQTVQQIEKNPIPTSSILYHPLPIQKAHDVVQARLACSPHGLIITRYIRCAIQLNLWEDFYSKCILSKRIYTHYCCWISELQAKGESINRPTQQSYLIKVLHGLLPNMHSIRKNSSTQYFPSKEEIEKQWIVSEKEIAKHKPLDRTSSGIKRKVDVLEGESLRPSSKKLKLAAHLALTAEGVWVAKYIEGCIKDKLWTSFYSKIVTSRRLYKHYCKVTEVNAFQKPTHKRMFMRTLHGLLPVIYPANQALGTEHFPSSDAIEMQWEATQKVLEGMSEASNDTVKRFVNDPSNKSALQETASLDELFDKYVHWCTEKAYHKHKNQVMFIQTLNSLMSKN